VVNRTTNVNVTNINVYRNVTVRNAVVGVSADRFGRHQERPQRIADADVRQLMPVRGALDVKPVPASVTVSGGTAARPPAAFEARGAVATRRPHDTVETLRGQGIATTHTAEPPTTPRIVPSPRSERGTERAPGPPQATPPQRQAVPPSPPRVERQERGPQPTAPGPQRQPAPLGPQPQVPGRTEPPANRSERQERGDRQDRGERPDRGPRPE